MSLLSVHNIDVIFGPNPKSTFPWIDSLETRTAIRQKTGHTAAVLGASLSVLKGEIVILMGLSGSGKSSLLRTFNGLNPISRGQVCFNGRPVENFQALRRQEISMVFQQPNLLPWENLANNIALGLQIKKLDRAAQKKLVLENLSRVGLSDWAESYPHELSGGMQQRAGIARALAMESSVLLMDEPFSALDPMTRSELQQELLRLQAELQKTILFVTHDLNEALLLGDRIVILEEGRILQIGTPTEITQNPSHQHIQHFVDTIQKNCPRCQDAAKDQPST